jgi:hypothetical protein
VDGLVAVTSSLCSRFTGNKFLFDIFYPCNLCLFGCYAFAL